MGPAILGAGAGTVSAPAPPSLAGNAILGPPQPFGPYPYTAAFGGPPFRQPFGPIHNLPGNAVPYSNMGAFALNPGVINPQPRMSSHLALTPSAQVWAGSPLLNPPPVIAHTNLATANVPVTSQNNMPAMNLNHPQANSTRNDGNVQDDHHPGRGRSRGRTAARHRDNQGYDSHSNLGQREPSTDDSDEEYQAGA